MTLEYDTYPCLVNAAYFGSPLSSYARLMSDPWRPTDQDQRELGLRFKALREVTGMRQEEAAGKLEVTKAALSAWETGRNMPNPFMLRRMAKLYGVSVDALLWDDSLSPDAMKFAAQYDNLSGRQREVFEAMWLAYFERAVSDEEVEKVFARNKTGRPETVHEPGPTFHYTKPKL